MKINYDKKVDALNVSIRPGTVAKTMEVAPEVLLDIDKKGRILNLEILGAREKVGARNFNTIYIGGKSFPMQSFAWTDWNNGGCPWDFMGDLLDLHSA